MVTMTAFTTILLITKAQIFSEAIKHQLQSITTAEREQFDRESFAVNIVKENVCIVDKARGWGVKIEEKIEENGGHLVVVSKRPKN